ncbi:MAG: chromate transporter [Clostridia bacterium]|nr:chromate transporter [Clostridia bacterium]
MERFTKLCKMFWIFFKIGSFTFGGGMAMLPLIQKEVVEKQNWLVEEDILDIFAISQSVPGVIAINSAFFIGNRVLGFSGAVFAALGVILPAFISILAIILILAGFENNIHVNKFFEGIRAASAALILLAALKLGKSAVTGKSGYIIALLSFITIALLGIHAIFIVILSGFAGYVMYLKRRSGSR